MKVMSALVMAVVFLGGFSLSYGFAAQKDPCKETGILVRNFSTRNLWYTVNDGPCTILVKDHNFQARPGDTAGVFSDMTCKTPYSRGKITYRGLRAKDSNGDCRVKIRPGGGLSDL